MNNNIIKCQYFASSREDAYQIIGISMNEDILSNYTDNYFDEYDIVGEFNKLLQNNYKKYYDLGFRLYKQPCCYYSDDIIKTKFILGKCINKSEYWSDYELFKLFYIDNITPDSLFNHIKEPSNINNDFAAQYIRNYVNYFGNEYEELTLQVNEYFSISTFAIKYIKNVIIDKTISHINYITQFNKYELYNEYFKSFNEGIKLNILDLYLPLVGRSNKLDYKPEKNIVNMVMSDDCYSCT